MERKHSFRDDRYLNKYAYCLMNDTFYVPMETSYNPFPVYINIVKDLLRDLNKDWQPLRDGLWFHVYPRSFAFPQQGWKVHISATLSNSESILRKAVKVALMNEVPFKFALDTNILALMESKRWQRGSSGKFITMYPADQAHFESLLEQLYEQLRFEEGPYILSDRRYKDCRVLYYRYGGITQTTQVDVVGKKVLVLALPGGEAVPDVRSPYFNPPSWVSDPFSRQKEKPRELTLHKGKYLIKSALAFSNSGGVYQAEDRETNTEVIIKEARAHTVMEISGNNAVKRLMKEYEILRVLQNTGLTAAPLKLFQEWDNVFLVQERLEGISPRQVLLTQGPLTQANPSLQDTQKYYEVYRVLMQNLARAIAVLHEHGIVCGDLSPNNVKVDPETYAVQLIDFEVAMRVGIDQSTELHTPGFKSASSIRQNTQGIEDDRYALGAIMMYMMFPIAALASLREDLFDTVLPILLEDIGWKHTELFRIITGLTKNELTCAQAADLLDAPAHIVPPRLESHVHDGIDAGYCDQVTHELGAFLLANMHPSQNGLFPSDAFMHVTNQLSWGFGACGVLYSLKKCGFEIPQPAYDWLIGELDKPDSRDLPPGLFTGASGIALSLWELGLAKRAAEFMKRANQSKILKHHPSYLYGAAGVGMANLHFYLYTRQSEYLEMAGNLADFLIHNAQENENGIYWENDGFVHVGFGYGQSGVALFLLRMYQLSGIEEYKTRGRKALSFDLSHGMELEKGSLSFPNTPGDLTTLPYLEEGSGGIAKVAMRYGAWEQMGPMLAEVHRKYAGFAGLMYGLGSFVDALTDAFLFSNNAKYLEMAKRPIAGLRDMYLLKRPIGLATPGDGLFRISCDYATGTAGVLRTLYRYSHHDMADFMLDELNAESSISEYLRSGAAVVR
ncbi:MAG TPA: class III lanthionine synthetase LanKC [Candidatus Angelobacter sp.]|nr:class III lanthionine synthetase LanKC [Candidatus Angelobacter sp.]